MNMSIVLYVGLCMDILVSWSILISLLSLEGEATCHFPGRGLLESVA